MLVRATIQWIVFSFEKGKVLKNKVLVIFGFILILGVVSGCAKSPTKVYQAMQKAAMKGDYETFADYFTKQSKPFVKALIALQKTDFSAEQQASLPLRILTQCTVLQEQKLQKGQVFLTLDCGGSKTRMLAFRKENGKWRVDIKLTEDLSLHNGAGK